VKKLASLEENLIVQNIKQIHLSSFIITLLTLTASTYLILFLSTRADSNLLPTLSSIILIPLVYVIDIVSYFWLAFALLSYSLINISQTSISNYFYGKVITNSSNELTAKTSNLTSKDTLGLPVELSPNTNLDKN
jgi:ribose/xylose/arabinose/galactoside ABC-type transport system permease subunit